jgi:hypothetical protein
MRTIAKWLVLTQAACTPKIFFSRTQLHLFGFGIRNIGFIHYYFSIASSFAKLSKTSASAHRSSIRCARPGN